MPIEESKTKQVFDITEKDTENVAYTSVANKRINIANKLFHYMDLTDNKNVVIIPVKDDGVLIVKVLDVASLGKLIKPNE